MARIRTIKPEFWTDEKVVELSPLARLLFIGLWNFADDEGRMVHSPTRIKLQILPADSADVSALLGEIRGKGLIVVYAVDGTEYLQIVNFGLHQKVDKRTPSKYPSPPTTSAEFPRVVPTEGNGREGIKEGKEQVPPPDGGPVWTECLQVLRDQNISEKQSRSFLGLLCREYEEKVIVDAVKASIGKANVTAYIRGVLRSQPKKGANRLQVAV